MPSAPYPQHNTLTHSLTHSRTHSLTHSRTDIYTRMCSNWPRPLICYSRNCMGDRVYTHTSEHTSDTISTTHKCSNWPRPLICHSRSCMGEKMQKCRSTPITPYPTHAYTHAQKLATAFDVPQHELHGRKDAKTQEHTKYTISNTRIHTRAATGHGL
jgi:hypothetical protein